MSIYMVVGGAGFIGSHLCRSLIGMGHVVFCVDNLLTGSMKNFEDIALDGKLNFIWHTRFEGDIVSNLDGIFYLASPTDPAAVKSYPLETLCSNGIDMYKYMWIAMQRNMKFMFISSVKIHGNCPRMTSYIVGKRYGEMLCDALGGKVARLANCYGPAMAMNDSRVIPTFIDRALKDEPLELWQGGRQIDSFCYVSDIVQGLIAFMESDCKGIMEFGAKEGISILDLADTVCSLTGSKSGYVTRGDIPVADECHKVADLKRARDELGWEPKVGIIEGLQTTIQDRIKRNAN